MGTLVKIDDSVTSTNVVAAMRATFSRAGEQGSVNPYFSTQAVGEISFPGKGYARSFVDMNPQHWSYNTWVGFIGKSAEARGGTEFSIALMSRDFCVNISCQFKSIAHVLYCILSPAKTNNTTSNTKNMTPTIPSYLSASPQQVTRIVIKRTEGVRETLEQHCRQSPQNTLSNTIAQ